MDRNMVFTVEKARVFQSASMQQGSVEASAAPEKSVRTRNIDLGPFVRQEGRYPVSHHTHSLRQESIRRIRMELGLPAEQTPPDEQGGMMLRLRAEEDRPQWMSWLVRKFRHAA